LSTNLALKYYYTECVTDLDKPLQLLSFGLILTSFKLTIVFEGSWGSTKNPKQSACDEKVGRDPSVEKHRFRTSIRLNRFRFLGKGIKIMYKMVAYPPYELW